MVTASVPMRAFALSTYFVLAAEMLDAAERGLHAYRGPPCLSPNSARAMLDAALLSLS